MEIKKLSCKTSVLKGEINLPTSKSISNRLLIIRALSKSHFLIDNLSKANDSLLMQKLLAKIDTNKDQPKPLLLDAEDAGTVLRFLTAFLSVQNGSCILTGNPRMQQRPIGILVDALRELGADIHYQNKEGFPPLLIHGKKLTSRQLHIQANISSQFISALLMIAPLLPNGLNIQFNEHPTSLPYIKMTVELMREYGIIIKFTNLNIEIQAGNYIPKPVVIEPDWSAASFWYQSIAFSKGGQLLLKGLKLNSVQGDAVLPKIFEELGVKTTITEKGIILEKSDSINYNFNYDFSNHPDLALPVISTCAGLGVIGKFSGLASLKIKESNRIEVLESELGNLGFEIRETGENEWLLINSCKVSDNKYNFSNIIINTYNDHRVAMSFAPFAILGRGIRIENPEVVHKSYPQFWSEFERVI
jgi:3-phosphoshikimate 1-carboxyvinyltransferase